LLSLVPDDGAVEEFATPLTIDAVPAALTLG
jgi:hypothetical protein